MSKNPELSANKIIARQQLGIDIDDPNYSVHHIIEKHYAKRGQLPEGFRINSIENLIALPNEQHRLIHNIIDFNRMFRNPNTHTYVANMVFNGDRDLIPRGLYLTDIEIRQPKKKKSLPR